MTLPHTRPPRHLHIFGISLLLIVGALVGFLFGVRMEATVPATGIVTSPRIITLRAEKTGVIEKTILPDSTLEPGTHIDGRLEIARIKLAGEQRPSVGGDPIRLPASATHWLILEVHFSDGQKIEAGDPIVTIYPIVALDDLPFHPVRLEIEEKNAGSVEQGQDVRLFSNMYPHRSHGTAKGIIEHLEPTGVEGANGRRLFHAWVRVIESPFPLKLGSSVRAEVIVGRKRTFQIILEH